MARIPFFGDPHEREVKRHREAVKRISALEPSLKELTDAELRARTDDFRERLGVAGPDLSLGQPVSAALLSTGDPEEDAAAEERRQEQEDTLRDLDAKLTELLPEAFAVVREASRRFLGMRHYDVQMIGGMVLHHGKIAEMRTGEGKTLAATLALYLNALLGRGSHLVTVNDYLARRDAGWNGPMFHALGMSISVIPATDESYIFDPDHVDDSHGDERLRHLRPCSRREAYAADITYSTNNELGFDYLRDNMARSLDQCVQRRLWYAIVDEVDSILVDEARTPLIISGQANEPTEKYYTYARLIPRLKAEDDFTIDEKTKSAALTEDGIAKIEQWTGIKNVYELEHASEAHQINQSLKAHALYLRDRDYIVRENEVIIVDEFTGRTMPGRRWSDGLHQAIEAKEGVRVQQENITLATITFQNFFRLYRKLAGMTGTALTEAEEFHKIYSLDVIPIPTNRPMIRKDESDLIYKTEEGKFKAVAEEIAERAGKGQPVLVGTTSIEKSERLSHLLEKRGIVHNVLNAKQHEREASIVAEAGKAGAVTIATNMAGRGTDIVLGEGVADGGGLYIIGTERHESRRIDNQLRGRSGRQGDPGETRFFLSFEDDLMRVFGGDRMQGLMDRLRIDEDTPIESRMVTRQIEGAQSRVEGQNFDSRRHVVEYDDVMNKQREVIYGERRKILEGTDTRHNLFSMIAEVVTEEVPTFCTSRHRENWDLEGLWTRLRELGDLPPFDEVDVDTLGSSVEELQDTILGEFTALYEEKEEAWGPEVMRHFEQAVMLEVIDVRWRSYLTEMDRLREGAGLVAYGQKDPLMEYKSEAFQAFQGLTADIKRNIVSVLMHLTLQRQDNVVPSSGGVPPDAVPAAPAPTELETAPSGGRADAGVGEEAAEDAPPAARPAASRASGRLDRAAARPAAAAGRVATAAGATAAPAAVPATNGAPRAGLPAPAPAPAPAAVGLPGSKVTNVVERGGSDAARPANGGGARRPSGGSVRVGRNEPCPCGSGLKYKKCHGAPTGTPAAGA